MEKRIVFFIMVLFVLAIGIAWTAFYFLPETASRDTYSSVTPLPQERVVEDRSEIDARVFLNLLKKGGLLENTTIEDGEATDEGSGPDIAYVSDDSATPYTLPYFQALEHHFVDSKDFESHVRSVCDYVHKNNEARDADFLCNLYRHYMEHQIEIGQDQEFAHPPETPELALEFLKDLQENRRQFFGTEMADALFGAEVKSHEYLIRRFAIRSDPSLYGAQKESRIKDLDLDMWGESASLIEEEGPISDGYSRYQEKLALYRKDISEMSPEMQQNFTDEIRKEYFPDEVVARLDEIEQTREDKKAREVEYRRRETRILNDPSISEREKEVMRIDLLYEVFGKEGDAFLRREAIRKAEESASEPEVPGRMEEDETAPPVY